MIVNDNTGRQQMIPNKSCRESSGPSAKRHRNYKIPTNDCSEATVL